MNKLRDVLTIAGKEIRLITRERGALAILFLLPLLVGSMMASMNLAAANAARGQKGAILLHVCMVDLDQGAFGPEIIKALKDVNILEMESLDTVELAEDRVAKGKDAAAIIIPSDFSAKIDAYSPTAIDVIVDPAQPQSTSIVTGIMNEVVSEVTIWGEVQYGIRSVFSESGVLATSSPEEQRAIQAQTLGTIMTRLNALRRTPAISVSSEDLQGLPVSAQFAGYFALLFPGLTVMFIFFGVSMAASGLLQEREVGTLRRLIAAPIAPSAVIFGKILAYVLLACVQTVVLLGVARVAFSMPLGNSPVGLVLLTLATALTATSLAMLLAALCKTSKQADSLGTMAGFVLGGLGGSIAMSPTPLWRTPGLMGIIANLTPHAHALEGFYSLMSEKAGVMQILPQVGILLLIAAVFFTIAVRRFKFE
jgi:ABC-2 type transport system permease protein